MSTSTVILVPGFTGSQLLDSFTFKTPFTGGVVWCCGTALMAGGFRLMRLPVPGEPPIGFAWRPLIPGGPHGTYFGLLASYLTLRGWQMGYALADWRRPLLFDALSLAAKIRTAAADGPVKILCHSRGGLVTRRAIAILNGLGTPGLVSRVVSLGTPHTGALNAVSALACWNSAKQTIIRWADYVPQAMSWWFSAEQVRATLRSWPGLYELLPKPGAPWLTGVGGTQLYDAATYASSPLNPYPPYLADALSQWGTLPTSLPGVDWISVAGVGKFTYNSVPDLGDVVTPHNLDGNDDGDGTVTKASAIFPGSKVITTPTTHDSLPIDGRLFPYLHSALQDGLAADITLGGRVF